MADEGGQPALPNVLENERFRLEIDPLTGYIASLRDKQAGCEVFTSEAAVPLVIDDPSDTWSHNVFKFDRVCGAFRASRVQLVERGPVKSVLRVTSEYASSRLVQDFTLYRDLDQIDVHVTVDWHEHFKMLKLRFPAHLHSMKATYEIPYGHIQRFASGEEEAGQGWVDLSGLSRDTGTLYGVSLLNDGKYSFDVNIRDIGLTVLRSPVYANHMPVVPAPGQEYSFIDQGIQRFTYSILPHTGSWEAAGTVRRAAELNQRPLALPGTTQPGASCRRPRPFSASTAPTSTSRSSSRRKTTTTWFCVPTKRPGWPFVRPSVSADRWATARLWPISAPARSRPCASRATRPSRSRKRTFSSGRHEICARRRRLDLQGFHRRGLARPPRTPARFAGRPLVLAGQRAGQRDA